MQLLEELGSLQYTRDFLKVLHNEIQQELQSLDGNPFFEKEFEGMMKIVDNPIIWGRIVGFLQASTRRNIDHLEN